MQKEPEFSKEREVTWKGTTLPRGGYISRMDFKTRSRGGGERKRIKKGEKHESGPTAGSSSSSPIARS